MKSTLLALLASVALTAVGYALLLAVGGLAGSWSADVLGEQFRALLLHFVVVVVRGVAPTCIAVGMVRAAARGRFSPNATTWLATFLVATAWTFTLLPSALGPLPRLQIVGPANGIATVLLLAGVCRAGWWIADRARP